MKPATIALALSLAALTATPAGLADDPLAPSLVEVQPTPDSGPEWVEFANPAPVDVPLEGLYLTDHDGCFAPGEGFVESYRWPLNVTLPALDRLVVELPQASNCLNLANTGDELVLEDEQGNELQSIAYGEGQDMPTPGTGESISACHAGAMVHASWSIADASPGSANPDCSLGLA